jgi:hypothetical protein
MEQKRLDISALCQRWLHSREEDTSTETVYRPASYSFPPSRGRSGCEFCADGTYKGIRVGPTDTSAVTEGTWRIEDENARRIRVDSDDTSRVLTIVSLNGDRLAIEKDT